MSHKNRLNEEANILERYRVRVEAIVEAHPKPAVIDGESFTVHDLDHNMMQAIETMKAAANDNLQQPASK